MVRALGRQSTGKSAGDALRGSGQAAIACSGGLWQKLRSASCDLTADDEARRRRGYPDS